MNMQKMLEGMNKTIRIGLGPDVGQVNEWLRTIEAAMREPVAEVREPKGSLTACHNTHGTIPVGTKLYEFPPDAAAELAAKDAELLSLTEQLAASREENSRLRKRRNEIDEEAHEYAEQVERLKADREKGHADYCALQDRYDDQHNEIERLRKALSDAERVLAWGEPKPQPVLQRVRAALKKEEPKP